LDRMKKAMENLQVHGVRRAYDRSEPIYDCSRWTAAVRRASLDLSRALADLRQGRH
jgi:hypothetical protein